MKQATIAALRRASFLTFVVKIFTVYAAAMRTAIRLR